MTVPNNNFGNITANITLDNEAVDPLSPNLGEQYYNTDVDRMMLYTGAVGFSTTPIYGDSISNFGAPSDSFDFDSNALTGLADPTNPQDAATKNYVDNSSGGTKAYGGAQNSSSASTVSVSNGVWTPLVAATKTLPTSSAVTVGSNYTLTYTGNEAVDMNIMLNVSLKQDQVTNTLMLAFFLNGVLYGNAGADVLQAVDLVPADQTVNITLATRITMSKNDYVNPVVTVVGTTATVTQTSVQFYIDQV